MVSEDFDLVLPNNCPISAATARSQQAYRLVNNNPPTDIDLHTHQERGLAPKADPCKRASISVFQTHEQAKHRLELSPHLGLYIAVAELEPAHGKIGPPQLQSGHMDWWPYKGMRKPTDFKVVES